MRQRTRAWWCSPASRSCISVPHWLRALACAGWNTLMPSETESRIGGVEPGQRGSNRRDWRDSIGTILWEVCILRNLRQMGWFSFLALALVVVLSQSTISLGAGRLAEIKQHGSLRLCAADWPYLVKDAKTGQWIGWDVDLANMYAAQLGVKVTWVD